MTTRGNSENHAALRRLLRLYVKPYTARILSISMCMLIVAATTAINAWLLQPTLDGIFLEKNRSMLALIPLIAFLNLCIKSAAGFFQMSGTRFLSERIGGNIQFDLYSHFIISDIAVIDQYQHGHILSRFTNDINALKESLRQLLQSSIAEVTTCIALFSVMLYHSPILTLIAFTILPVAFFYVFTLGKKMKKIVNTTQNGLENLIFRLDEVLQNIRIVRSYCREKYERIRGKDILEQIIVTCKRAAYFRYALPLLMELVCGGAIAFVIWYGGKSVIEMQLTTGAFFSFVIALFMLYRPLSAVISINTSLEESIALSSRIFAVLDDIPTIIEDRKFPTADNLKCNIVISDVHFSYYKNHKVLSGLNMKIPEGKTVAILGKSGAGKTTILQLLQRFYEVDSGVISLGGLDIKSLRLSSLRQAMAFVSQDIALFDDTILENIKYGRLDAEQAEIDEAANLAFVDEFVQKLPDKYNTRVGKNGLQLSGGQRQRISIARAILKNAPILLLDEATSALDRASEHRIQEALTRLKDGRTTIVIAHRMTTIENADLVYVIANGRVVESGKYSDIKYS